MARLVDSKHLFDLNASFYLVRGHIKIVAGSGFCFNRQ